MMENTEIINIVMGVWGVVVSALAVMTSYIFQYEKMHISKVIRDWRIIISLNMVSLVCDILANVFAGSLLPAGRIIKSICEFSNYLVNISMLLIYTETLIRHIGDVFWKEDWKKITRALAVVYLALVISSLKNHWVYWIDAENVYHRGPYFIVVWVLCGIIEIGNLIFLLLSYKRMNKMIFISYLIFIICPMIAIVLQTIFYGISFIYIFITLALILMYVISQNSIAAQLVEQQRKLSDERMQTMLSQLQPHFLYNALTAIMAIEGNPPETKEAIRNFAGYLRGNLNSLGKQEVIPFEQELQHIETYVSLEKLRFENKLDVKFFMETTNFMVPPLRIQMLVENAIKHGIQPKNGPGCVQLIVKERIGYYEITVLDDGIGFDTEKLPNDVRSHLGVESSRFRLKKLIGADMTIQSIPEKGTRVTVVIPMTDI